MVRIGIAGLGKMGISHYSMLNVHPNVSVVGVCDTFGYLTSTLNKYTGVAVCDNLDELVAKCAPQALVIATPSRHHDAMVRTALDNNLHVFCEKPFCLDSKHSSELAQLAADKKLTNQAGYHYRFVGAFQEMKRLLDAGAIGKVTHVLAEAYGPVVLKAKGTTWRTKGTEGGGCLYDYAAHPINLLNWFFGMPQSASGTLLKSLFSEETDDEVYSTLRWKDGLSAQLSVNWSDDSHRKMTTKITVWGTEGRLIADRQECTAYLRKHENLPEGYQAGWNKRYTTDLTEPVWFYVRGEEYSAQLDYFVSRVENPSLPNINSFASAAETDRTIEMMLADHRGEASRPDNSLAAASPKNKRRTLSSLFSRAR